MKDRFKVLLSRLILRCLVPSKILPPISKGLHSQLLTVLYKDRSWFYRASCLHNWGDPLHKKRILKKIQM